MKNGERHESKRICKMCSAPGCNSIVFGGIVPSAVHKMGGYYDFIRDNVDYHSFETDGYNNLEDVDEYVMGCL